jgi:Putative MetA-pathway of phenol degradation
MAGVGARATIILATALVLGVPVTARAQSMEPLLYTNAPIGLNFLIAGYSYLWGDILADPSLPVKGANAKVNSAVLNYSRVLDFWGQSGTVAVIVPYAWLSASGEVAGQSRSVDRTGLADVTLRASVNLYGAPALSLQEFRDYRQDTIVGASVLVTAPTGQYDPMRLINIGTNRWSFRPEIGISKALGHWSFEAAAGVTFFTNNDQFLGANVRSQEPLYGVQGHVIYNFGPALWVALDGTYYWGGRTSVNGALDDDPQANSRWGGTIAQTLSKHNSIKLYFSSGLAARTGTNFHAVGIAWQYRWGAGL